MSLFPLMLGLLLVGAPAGQNLIPNPGFEDGLQGWLLGHGWYELLPG
jgi:hypothetical protein